MAITRRQFVTRLGALATAMGLGQADLAKITEAWAHGGPWLGNGLKKPKVIWVHGAECTGCSTSLLSLFENAAGTAIPGVSTAAALNVVAGGTLDLTTNKLAGTILDDPHGHRTLATAGLNVDGSANAVNIADVLIDFIDLQYHETVMGMGGDLAYTYLESAMAANDGVPFVLVVEGAVQKKDSQGYWGSQYSATAKIPWCSIAADGEKDAHHELSFEDVVGTLANRVDCKAVIAIGQCATWGGYPACKGPGLVDAANRGKNQTGAQGVYDFLAGTGAQVKVINVPGCPVNPWWFVLTVVAWLVDVVTAGPAAQGALKIIENTTTFKPVGGIDSQRRLTAVYPATLHSKYCPRYKNYVTRDFAAKPGDKGCLKNLGCKGMMTVTSCGRHGWNGQQPQNLAAGGLGSRAEGIYYTSTDGTKMGGNCVTAGAPCMGCTEKGYPDAFTPYVVL